MDAIAIKDNPTRRTSGRYKKYYEDATSLLMAVRKGLKPEAVFDFIAVSKLTNNHVEHLLNKTMKTFNNYKTSNTVLDATTSEKLLKLFELYEKGADIFGTTEQFNLWLSMPSIGLGGTTPETFLDTVTGIEYVTGELIRIEYGDLA